MYIHHPTYVTTIFPNVYISSNITNRLYSNNTRMRENISIEKKFSVFLNILILSAAISVLLENLLQMFIYSTPLRFISSNLIDVLNMYIHHFRN